MIQSISRVLMEEAKYDRVKVTSVDWASYPIIRFPMCRALKSISSITRKKRRGAAVNRRWR